MSNLKIGPVDITSGTAAFTAGGLTVGTNQLSVANDGTVLISNQMTVYPTGITVLTKGTGTGTSLLELRGDAGSDRGIRLCSGSSLRWLLTSNMSAETGSNAGSDFMVIRFSDTGAFLDSPLNIPRVSGVPNFGNGLTTITKTSSDNSNFVATTEFVHTVANTKLDQTTADARYAPINTSSGCTIYTTPGSYTFTVPTGITKVFLTGAAGGGGFLWRQVTYNDVGAGGFGQVCFKYPITVTSGASITVQVGDAGSNLTVTTGSNYTATSGGNTVFGSTTLTGGGGGHSSGSLIYAGTTASPLNGLGFFMRVDGNPSGRPYGDAGWTNGDTMSPITSSPLGGYLVIEW